MDAAQDRFFDLTRPSRWSLNVIIGLHLLQSLAQAAVLLVVPRWFDLGLDVEPLWRVAGAYAAWNVGSLLLLLARRHPVTNLSVLVQLLAEVACLSGLLYFSGGPTNPFVSLYLVPVALSATVLPVAHTLALALASVAAYSALMFQSVSLPALQIGHVHNGWNLHVAGMWVNFVVSAIVVLVFLSLLVGVSRRRAEQLASLRERAIRDEQVVTMGSIAATAAHSMATPLSTVQLLVDELGEDLAAADRRETVELARQQIEQCRSRLTELLEAGGIGRLTRARQESLRTFLDSLLAQWLTTRPEARLGRHIHTSVDGVAAILDPTLRHSLTNLLNNALDASLEGRDSRVEFHAALSGRDLRVVVEDLGPGPPADLEAVEFASTKASGIGVGLLLARANLSRMGGRLHLEDRKPGCRVVVTVPLAGVEHPA